MRQPQPTEDVTHLRLLDAALLVDLVLVLIIPVQPSKQPSSEQRGGGK